MFFNKKKKEDALLSDLLKQMVSGERLRCLRDKNRNYIHEQTNSSSKQVVYTQYIGHGHAKTFTSDEDAVNFLHRLVSNGALTNQQASDFDLVDILS